MLILLGSIDSNFLIRIFQASFATLVLSMAVCSSGEMHNRIWLDELLFLLFHSSVSAIVAVVVGATSVLIMVAYRPRSLAVASNSCFQMVQLSCLSFGFMSWNLWMSCFWCEAAVSEMVMTE